MTDTATDLPLDDPNRIADEDALLALLRQRLDGRVSDADIEWWVSNCVEFFGVAELSGDGRELRRELGAALDAGDLDRVRALVEKVLTPADDCPVRWKAPPVPDRNTISPESAAWQERTQAALDALDPAVLEHVEPLLREAWPRASRKERAEQLRHVCGVAGQAVVLASYARRFAALRADTLAEDPEAADLWQLGVPSSDGVRVVTIEALSRRRGPMQRQNGRKPDPARPVAFATLDYGRRCLDLRREQRLALIDALQQLVSAAVEAVTQGTDPVEALKGEPRTTRESSTIAKAVRKAGVALEVDASTSGV